MKKQLLSEKIDYNEMMADEELVRAAMAEEDDENTSDDDAESNDDASADERDADAARVASGMRRLDVDDDAARRRDGRRGRRRCRRALLRGREHADVLGLRVRTDPRGALSGGGLSRGGARGSARGLARRGRVPRAVGDVLRGKRSDDASRAATGASGDAHEVRLGESLARAGCAKEGRGAGRGGERARGGEGGGLATSERVCEHRLISDTMNFYHRIYL